MAGGEGIVMAINPARIYLSLRIRLGKLGLLPCLVMTFLLVGVMSWFVFSVQARTQKKQVEANKQTRRATPKQPVLVPAAQSGSSQRNLRAFYDLLGDSSEAERHVSSLFSIAAKIGIDLDQGEYKWEFDRNSRTYRYQIVLPVKGSYSLIRQFCEKSLLAIPFASLDEVKFRREAVGEDTLDGSVKFTIFYSESPRARRDSPVGS